VHVGGEGLRHPLRPPALGFWSEFVTRYEDGTLATFTDARARRGGRARRLGVRVRAEHRWRCCGSACSRSARGSRCSSARARAPRRISRRATPSPLRITSGARPAPRATRRSRATRA
jgi:hypothetical protein